MPAYAQFRLRLRPSRSGVCVWHDKNAKTTMHVYVSVYVSSILFGLFQNTQTHTYTAAHTTVRWPVCPKQAKWR